MTYIVDFAKNVTARNNAGIFIYLILNTLLVTLLFQSFFGGLFIYLLSLTIALSPMGEWILRKQQGCKPLKRREHMDRLHPLFEEIYQKAKAIDPGLPEDIKLFISKDPEPNAFATGRKTVCLTKGMLDYSDDQIKAILAHEFGHLSRKDTDLILIIAVGNLIVSVLFIFYRIVFTAIGIAAGVMSRSLSTVVMTIFIDLVLVGLMWVWTKLGIMLVMHASRRNEYLADEFASRCGYNESLITTLDALQEGNESTGKGLWANLAASHPDPDERIGKLQVLQQPVG
ncbi:zinc metalloprotease HtpX [Salibacterium sp. K-3]